MAKVQRERQEEQQLPTEVTLLRIISHTPNTHTASFLFQSSCVSEEISAKKQTMKKFLVCLVSPQHVNRIYLLSKYSQQNGINLFITNKQPDLLFVLFFIFKIRWKRLVTHLFDDHQVKYYLLCFWFWRVEHSSPPPPPTNSLCAAVALCWSPSELQSFTCIQLRKVCLNEADMKNISSTEDIANILCIWALRDILL